MREKAPLMELNISELHTEEDGLATAEYGIVMLGDDSEAKAGFHVMC